MEEPDNRHRRVLCACSERKSGRRAAEQRDNLAAVHSITSSARASNCGGTGDAKHFCSLEVDDQLEFGRLLHRQIGWLSALQNAIDVFSRSAVLVDNIASI